MQSTDRLEVTGNIYYMVGGLCRPKHRALNISFEVNVFISSLASRG